MMTTFFLTYLTISIKLNVTILYLPDTLAKISYTATDHGPSFNDPMLSFPAVPLPILKLCLGETFVVNLSMMARMVTKTWIVHSTCSYLNMYLPFCFMD